MPAYLGLAFAGTLIVSVGTIYLLATVVLPTLQELFEQERERQEDRRLEKAHTSTHHPLTPNPSPRAPSSPSTHLTSAFKFSPELGAALGLRRRKQSSAKAETEPEWYKRRDSDTNSIGLGIHSESPAIPDAPMLTSTTVEAQVSSRRESSSTIVGGESSLAFSTSSSRASSRKSSRSGGTAPLLSPDLIAFSFSDFPLEQDSKLSPFKGPGKSSVDVEISPFTLFSDDDALPPTTEGETVQCPPIDDKEEGVADWDYLLAGSKTIPNATYAASSDDSIQAPSSSWHDIVREPTGSTKSSDGFEKISPPLATSSRSSDHGSHHSTIRSRAGSSPCDDWWDPLSHLPPPPLTIAKPHVNPVFFQLMEQPGPTAYPSPSLSSCPSNSDFSEDCRMTRCVGRQSPCPL